ncbi:hypothetical protein CRENBAI_012705 [Crenichthys baileyi]|uniref:Uncharacterized protein n=1 Tax=Crenichthys baileyi TaxID=28760 RepID=A0AAV9QLK4_9TELE
MSGQRVQIRSAGRVRSGQRVQIRSAGRVKSRQVSGSGQITSGQRVGSDQGRSAGRVRLGWVSGSGQVRSAGPDQQRRSPLRMEGLHQNGILEEKLVSSVSAL